MDPHHTDEQELDDQLEPIYNSSVLILDVAWKTHRTQWTIETSSERGSEKPVLVQRHEDEDDIYAIYASYAKIVMTVRY